MFGGITGGPFAFGSIFLALEFHLLVHEFLVQVGLVGDDHLRVVVVVGIVVDVLGELKKRF